MIEPVSVEDADEQPLQVHRLTAVGPILPSLSNVLYEYTVPELTARARRSLGISSSERSVRYTGYKEGQAARRAGPEHAARVLEAARLVSGLYAHYLDPFRFGRGGATEADRASVFNGFARALLGDRFLPAVEQIARDIPILRSLDDHQPELGTNTARWMQYLAYEASRSTVVRDGYSLGKELDRLRNALAVIRESATIMDRFRALARDGH